MKYLLTAILAATIATAHAQTPVKVGVLTNQTGIGAASGGPGTVVAARMAVADFGPTVLGRPIQLTDADFAFKAVYP
jgi:branched-chain amino acid transport system substrate-binding protein